MAVTSTNIKTDPALKQDAQTLFERLGLNLSTAVNIFFRQAVHEQAIPLRTGSPCPNEETLRAIYDVQNSVDLSRAFSSVDKLMEKLNADD